MNKLIVGYMGKAKDFKPVNFIILGKIKLNQDEKEVTKNDTK